MSDHLTDRDNAEAMFGDDLPGGGVRKPGEQSEKLNEKLSKVKRWWTYARSLQADNRTECLRDHDYYDGDQWREDDKREVESRGQIAIVFNRVKPAADWIIGTEKKNRIDYRVLPRSKEDGPGAEVKTKLLKYLSDVNKIPHERSQAFKDAVISGLGWMEAGITADPSQELVFCDYEDWRNIWFDPLSVRLDFKDARFLFRRKRLDLDVACAMFPDHADALRMQARNRSDDDHHATVNYWDDDTDVEDQIEGHGMGDWHGEGQRNRCELVECWYRTPQKVDVFMDGTEDIGTLRGKRVRPDNPAHRDIIAMGYASTTQAIRMVIRYMIYCGNIVLQDQDSPYDHDRFPFVPVWGWRRKRDNSPFGMVRNLRDIQDDLNKRRSKAQFILATNQVIADDDAVEDWEELADEVSRPDGIIRKKPKSELVLNRDRALAREHVELMSQDAEYIEATSGVTDEQMGRETNAVSGKAIELRKEQGNVVVSELFDNLRVSVQLMGEILLSLVEQFYTDEKVVRITDDKNQPEFIPINHADPVTGEVENDITASQADFIVDSSAWTASLRQATFQQFMELAEKMPPEVSLNLLDLIIDLSDIPGKDDFVARIRAMNGQQDPDADPDDPQAQAEAQAKAQAEQQQAQAAQLAQELELQKLQSEIDKNVTDAAATKAGIAFDQEKLRIEKAKTLHAIQSGNKDLDLKAQTVKAKDAVQATKKGEHGVKSDNQNKGAK